MKRYFIIFILLIIITSVFIYKNYNKNETEDLQIIKESSFYNDFYIEEGKVYIECKITIKNNGNKDRIFKLYGIFEDDVQLGLLKAEELVGYNQELTSTEFTVEKNTKEFLSVIFIVDYAGTYKKHDRNLPVIKIDIVE